MTNPFSCFQKIWIINLATRGDRRREMSRQLQRVGLSFQSPMIQLFSAVRPADPGGFTSVGARGCFLSHLGILNEAAAQGLERILILEDDVNFSDDIGQRLGVVMASAARQSWSLFYGGYEVTPDVRLEGTNCVIIAPEDPVRTTHFIGFRGPAIAAAATYLGAMLTRAAGDALGGPMHVDGAYTWFRRANPQFNTLVAVPQLGYQRASRTDIHELRWYDRWVGARSVVGKIRQWRN